MFKKKEKMDLVVNTGAVNLYSIYDRIAEDSCPPFMAKNDGVALRSFHLLMKDMDMAKREEYKLYRLGSYDPVKMELVAGNPQEVLVEVIE